MRVRSDRRYRFDVGPDVIWDRICGTAEYRRWWPWLREFDEGDGLIAGEKWACVVQPPLPYRLRFMVELTDVDECRAVTAALSGDIEGTARFELARFDGGCEARMISELAPANPFLKSVAAVARPVVRFGHDWVMDTGAKQFRSRAL